MLIDTTGRATQMSGSLDEGYMGDFFRVCACLKGCGWIVLLFVYLFSFGCHWLWPNWRRYQESLQSKSTLSFLLAASASGSWSIQDWMARHSPQASFVFGCRCCPRQGKGTSNIRETTRESSWVGFSVIFHCRKARNIVEMFIAPSYKFYNSFLLQ